MNFVLTITVSILFSFSSMASVNLKSPILKKVYKLLKPINKTLSLNGTEPYNVYAPLMYVTCIAKSNNSMFDCVESEAVQLFNLLGGTSGWGSLIERDDITGNYPQEYFDSNRFPKEAMKRLQSFHNVWENKGFIPRDALSLIFKSNNIEFAYFRSAFSEVEPAKPDSPSVELGIVIWDNVYEEGLILSYDSSTSKYAQKL